MKRIKLVTKKLKVKQKLVASYQIKTPIIPLSVLLLSNRGQTQIIVKAAQL